MAKSAIKFKIAITFIKAAIHIQNYQNVKGKMHTKITNFNMEIVKRLSFLKQGKIPQAKSFKHLNYRNEVALEIVCAAYSFLNWQNNSDLRKLDWTYPHDFDLTNHC